MSAEPEMPDLDGIEDPDDYKQRQRIKSILEARETVLEERQKALDLRVRGEITADIAAKIVREAVERYILESEQTIRRYIPSGETEPTGDIEDLAQRVGEEVELGRLQMQTREVVFTGVFDVVDAPEQFRDSWEGDETNYIGDDNRDTFYETYQVPVQVSKNAYRQLNRFWNEAGMDLDMDQTMPTDHL